MKLIILVLFSIFPFIVFADTYQDIAGASQMVADSFDDLWSFFFDDVPSLLQRFVAQIIYWATYIKFLLMLEFIKFASGIAKVIIQDLNIMSQITSQITSLPQDVRQAAVDMRIFDGLNLVLQAFVTRFVMNFIR